MFAERPEGCYLGDCPTLFDVREIYGREEMRLWLSTHLNYVCVCLGRAFVSSGALQEYVNTLCLSYSYLKLTEWMLFFVRLRSGRYGKIYGDLSPDYCTDALKMFLRERNAELDKYERQLSRAYRPDRSGCVTYQEYLRMKEAGELNEIASEK